MPVDGSRESVIDWHFLREDQTMWILQDRRPASAMMVVVIGLAIAAALYFLPDLISFRGQYYDGRPAGYWERTLKSSDVESRRQAIRAVSTFGSDEAEESVPVLAHILSEDQDPQARVLASLALAKLVPASRAAIPELTRALADDDLLVRMNVANALFLLGTDSRPAVPTLIKALDDERNDTPINGFTATPRERVILALGRASAGTTEALAILREALKTAKTSWIRRAVAQALGDVGPEARPALADLKELLDDKHTLVREAAEDAIKKINR
jgi:HEAT repeat protein